MTAKAKPEPIKERIRRALRVHGDLSFHRLADIVFPESEYPNAGRYAVQGGPPGCYMALSRAVREMELHVSFPGNIAGHRIVHAPREK